MLPKGALKQPVGDDHIRFVWVVIHPCGTSNLGAITQIVIVIHLIGSFNHWMTVVNSGKRAERLKQLPISGSARLSYGWNYHVWSSLTYLI